MSKNKHKTQSDIALKLGQVLAKNNSFDIAASIFVKAALFKAKKLKQNS